MRQLAQEIIDAQKAEIEQMQNWLANHPDAAEPTSDTEAIQTAYAKGMDTMHSEMMTGIADLTQIWHLLVVCCRIILAQ